MDINTVKYLADLSKLNFDEKELEHMAHDMTDIIALMDTIKDIDVTYDPLKDNKNLHIKDLREDAVLPSFKTENILANGVNANNCFVVPKVVE